MEGVDAPVDENKQKFMEGCGFLDFSSDLSFVVLLLPYGKHPRECL